MGLWRDFRDGLDGLVGVVFGPPLHDVDLPDEAADCSLGVDPLDDPAVAWDEPDSRPGGPPESPRIFGLPSAPSLLAQPLTEADVRRIVRSELDEILQSAHGSSRANPSTVQPL